MFRLAQMTLSHRLNCSGQLCLRDVKVRIKNETTGSSVVAAAATQSMPSQWIPSPGIYTGRLHQDDESDRTMSIVSEIFCERIYLALAIVVAVLWGQLPHLSTQ